MWLVRRFGRPGANLCHFLSHFIFFIFSSNGVENKALTSPHQLSQGVFCCYLKMFYNLLEFWEGLTGFVLSVKMVIPWGKFETNKWSSRMTFEILRCIPLGIWKFSFKIFVRATIFPKNIPNHNEFPWSFSSSYLWGKFVEKRFKLLNHFFHLEL